MITTNGAEASGTFAVGTTTVTATATDDAGHKTLCSFAVVITDNEAPSIWSCPGLQSEVTSTGGTGDGLATVTFTA
eukprot:3415530-Rhodomonas_salina.1